MVPKVVFTFGAGDSENSKEEASGTQPVSGAVKEICCMTAWMHWTLCHDAACDTIWENSTLVQF